MQRPRAKGGTGLGLSICCKQVAVLGGAIGALSKPACGSIFWFTTPLLLPPHGSSSSDSLEASSEGEAAAADAVAEAEEAAAAAAAEAAPTPRQAAGAAAMRRSREFHCAAATEAAAVAAAHGDEGLPRGIPAGHSGRKASGESSQLRGGSGSRRQSMESDLSSMWPSHKAPRPHGSATRLDQMEEDASYHPRHALSWETAPQPPSFTAAEMLQAMPLALGGGGGGSSGGVPAAAVPRRGAPTGRTSLGGAVAHLGAVRHHQAATAPAPCGAAAGAGVAAADAARRRQSSSSLLGLRVLLAEDNLINQTVAKRVLTSLGCQCCVASNGREAVMVSRACARGSDACGVLVHLRRVPAACALAWRALAATLPPPFPPCQPACLPACAASPSRTPLPPLPPLCARLWRRPRLVAPPLTSSSWTCACRCWAAWRPRRCARPCPALHTLLPRPPAWPLAAHAAAAAYWPAGLPAHAASWLPPRRQQPLHALTPRFTQLPAAGDPPAGLPRAHRRNDGQRL